MAADAAGAAAAVVAPAAAAVDGAAVDSAAAEALALLASDWEASAEAQQAPRHRPRASRTQPKCPQFCQHDGAACRGQPTGWIKWQFEAGPLRLQPD